MDKWPKISDLRSLSSSTYTRHTPAQYGRTDAPEPLPSLSRHDIVCSGWSRAGRRRRAQHDMKTGNAEILFVHLAKGR